VLKTTFWKLPPLSSSPIEVQLSWDQITAERDFTGTNVGTGGAPVVGIAQDDLETNIAAATLAVWVWSPKGFLTGNRNNGGVRVSYNYQRSDWDLGDGGTVGNDFGNGSRLHMKENIIYVRWFQLPNVSWGVQYLHGTLSRMEGGGTAPTRTRRRLGIDDNGGSFQNVVFNTVWRF